jgi:hypothetical protein
MRRNVARLFDSADDGQLVWGLHERIEEKRTAQQLSVFELPLEQRVVPLILRADFLLGEILYWQDELSSHHEQVVEAFHTIGFKEAVRQLEGYGDDRWSTTVSRQVEARLAAYVRARPAAYNDLPAGKPVHPDLAPPKPNASSRAVAKWLLSLRADVHLDREGLWIATGRNRRVPRTEFPITCISWHSSRNDTDQSLETLSRLHAVRELRNLALHDTWVSDRGLAYVARFKELAELAISRSQVGVTDAGLRHLSRLKSLTHLILFEVNIRGPGLKHLGNLANLSSLNLGFTPLNGKYLAVFQDSNLEELGLRGSAITDAGLATVAGIRSLKRLDLWHTGIGDAGLKRLRPLQNLEELILCGTKVTNNGLALLASFPKLRLLHFWGHELNRTGLHYLARLPNLKELKGDFDEQAVLHLRDQLGRSLVASPARRQSR